MAEMTEIVSRALFEKLMAEDDTWSLARGKGPESVTLDGQFDLRELAAAAIQAMRRPTRAMAAAGEKALRAEAGSIEVGLYDFAPSVFQAMIEAELLPQSQPQEQPGWLERLERECQELTLRKEKLRAFTESLGFEDMDESHRILLQAQLHVMDAYERILLARLLLAKAVS